MDTLMPVEEHRYYDHDKELGCQLCTLLMQTCLYCERYDCNEKETSE